MNQCFKEIKHVWGSQNTQIYIAYIAYLYKFYNQLLVSEITVLLLVSYGADSIVKNVCVM